jgi:hypothetical protein
MFFKHKNGSYHRIPQVGNGGPQGQLINKGGLDVYYIPSGKVTAFKAVSMAGRIHAYLHAKLVSRMVDG